MKRIVLLLLGAALTLVAVWCLGAIIAALFTGRTAGAIVAGLATLAVCFALPLWWDRKLLAAARKDEPDAKSTLGQLLLL